MKNAKAILPFDTGAFSRRLYREFLLEEMSISDFALPVDPASPNKIISAVFSSLKNYLNGDSTDINAPDSIAEPWEFHARAYLNLIATPGRNEPDDGLSAIEVLFSQSVPLLDNLKALIVPHTLWDGTRSAPWLHDLHSRGVQIIPYLFVPGRHPEHYQALVESAVFDLYEAWGLYRS
jgi:hypothetical protein